MESRGRSKEEKDAGETHVPAGAPKSINRRHTPYARQEELNGRRKERKRGAEQLRSAWPPLSWSASAVGLSRSRTSSRGGPRLKAPGHKTPQARPQRASSATTSSQKRRSTTATISELMPGPRKHSSRPGDLRCIRASGTGRDSLGVANMIRRRRSPESQPAKCWAQG